MATLSFNRAISQDGKTLYFIDATEYPVGGDERASLAVFGLAIFKHSSGDQVITPSSYLPVSVESFAFNVEGKDGVYEGKFFAVPIYTEQALEEGDIVYNTEEGELQKYIDSNLVAIDVQDLLEEETAHSGSKHALVTRDISIARDELLLAKLEKQEEADANCCEYNEVIKASRNYDYVRTLRQAAFIEFCRGNYTSAQTKIETGNAFAEKALQEDN